MPFSLHPQLEKDSLIVGDLAHCRVLLMNNRHFPWLVLVPRRENLREIFDLTPPDYAAVMEEAHKTAQIFCTMTGAHKMNVAALGNVVPQLHIHIIARFENDAAWPSPVWNAKQPPLAYEPAQSAALIIKLKSGLGL